MDIPPSAPTMNATADEFSFALSPDGSARGAVRGTAAGNRAMVLRKSFARPEVRGKILSRLHGRQHQGATAVGVSFSDLADLNTPVSYSYSLDLPALARPQAGGLLVDPPENSLRGVLGYDNKDQLFPQYFAGYAPGAQRVHDVVLPSAWQASVRCEVRVPEGFAPAELPPDARLETEFGKLTITRKFEAGRLAVEKFVQLSVTRVPVEKYAAFRDFCLKVDRLEAEKVLLLPRKDAKEKPGSGKNGKLPPAKEEN
jgi:hypothetical protein